MQSGVYHEDIKSVDTGYRYEGKNPNNYIWFNNELWRIIGVFDESSHGIEGQYLVKIIREESIGALAWNKNAENDWSASSLKALLNGSYLNREDGTESGNCYGFSSSVKSNCDYTDIGIGILYRNMIENVIWYLGGKDTNKVTLSSMYENKRQNGSTEGYIGLMYVSDYGYTSLKSSCARTTLLYDYYSKCSEENWLFGYGNTWTITPNSSNSDDIFTVDSRGGIQNHERWYYGYSVLPVLYLKNDVYIYAGDGSKDNPYIIGM